jgi:uncharacterized protein
MSTPEILAIFVLGLVSSLHCLQMCGPIVLAYSVSLPNPRRALRSHAAYNGGRILTYMLLGTIAGAVGSGVGMLGRMAGLASGARIVSGAAMIVAGIVMVRPLRGTGLVQIKRLRLTQSKFTLGLALGFLPCGLIYAALLKAMESGSALSGGLTMLAFGLGTACALFAMGAASSFAGMRLGRWSNRLAAVSVMIFGAILLWRGILARPICHG